MFDKELHKNESLEFHNQGFFDIILGWDDFQEGKWMEDIDLCAFFRKKNGETGGVFNNTYNHNKVTEGSLSESPFIFLFGEERINPKYKCEDIIRVANIDEMEEVFLVAIDYNATIEENTGFDLPIMLELNENNLAVKISYTRTNDTQGTILLFATLKVSNNASIVITNQSKLMTLSDAFKEIPGFASIVTS